MKMKMNFCMAGTGMTVWSFLGIFLYCLGACQAQLSWTPIYVDTTNQVDLWTVKERGCGCPDDAASKDCACCAKPGGCLCSLNYNKCAQCGLEDACQRFCNVSISSWTIATKSGLSWVQLKSPSLQGPTSCWWRLESAPGQRIEVQIHRLISVGSFDNSTQKCTKGFVQFSPDDTTHPSTSAVQLCGENSRFSPPIVIFADQGIATLLLRIEGRTSRSQLLAYASFSSADDPLVGDPSKGGRQKSHSVCDWTYENCWTHDCVLTSPGFPGLAQPYRRCRYFLSGNSTTNRIRLTFQTLSFLQMHNTCSSHHLAIWKTNASTTNTNVNLVNIPPWKLLCDQTDVITTVDIDGTSHAVLEFRPGPTVSPYVHNGFRATVQFMQTQVHGSSGQVPSENFEPSVIHGRNDMVFSRPKTATPTPPSLFNRKQETPMKNQQTSYGVSEGVYPITCGKIFDGEVTRGHVFRLLIPKDLTLRPPGSIMSFGTYLNGNGASSMVKKPPPGPFKCQIEFHGRPTDIIQFAAFNYKFRGSNCSTTMEIYDMEPERTNHSDRFLGKLCGPTGNEVKRFTSSHSRLALVTLIYPHEEPLGTEFLEGAFQFHDESVEGTVKPMSSCEVVYYGVTSSPSGSLTGPPDSPLLLLSTFPLVCAYSFLPAVNQTVSLMLTGAGHDSVAMALPNSLNYCRTICGKSGCLCESKYTPMDQIDHLLILSGIATPIACLCGYFKDILPLAFESHIPLTFVYHATKGGREFTYAVGYQFKNKITCANFTISPPSSSKRWKEILGPSVQYNNRFNGNLHYTYFQCIWSVSIPTRYKLMIDFISEENEEDCHMWNLTIWAGNKFGLDPTLDDLLFSFCPKDGRKEFQLPETAEFAFLKLMGVTLRPPQFDIRWRYIDVMLGSGFLTERIITNNSFTMHTRIEFLLAMQLSLVLLINAVFLIRT